MIREEDIDQVLLAWDERLRRVDENLIALEAEPTYQMLSGSARATLRGRTRDRVVPALDALGELFEHRERLNAVIARAKEVRAGVSFWNKDERLAEIAALLHGPSITLGTQQMPVAQRNLLDAASTDVAVVPEQLLAGMAHAYQVARDAVAEVTAAWSRVEPRLLEIEREVAEAQRDAASLGLVEETQGALGRVVAELARVRTLVSTDPLGAAGHVDAELGPELAQLKATLAQQATHRANVTRAMEEADATLARIPTVTAAALEATARAAREIAGFDVGASARSGRQEIVRGLTPWREKIAQAAASGHWRSADVGLARWLEVARGVVDAELAATAAARAAEAERSELEGRLSARRAQAAVLAARGVTLPYEVDQAARDAEATLRARPTDLAKARGEVDRYEAAVRALGVRAR